eukprot:9000265-Lingulodinium_polyedra.AAC.1
MTSMVRQPRTRLTDAARTCGCRALSGALSGYCSRPRQSLRLASAVCHASACGVDCPLSGALERAAMHVA